MAVMRVGVCSMNDVPTAIPLPPVPMTPRLTVELAVAPRAVFALMMANPADDVFRKFLRWIREFMVCPPCEALVRRRIRAVYEPEESNPEVGWNTV